jgi:hypothetical protein
MVRPANNTTTEQPFILECVDIKIGNERKQFLYIIALGFSTAWASTNSIATHHITACQFITGRQGQAAAAADQIPQQL